VTTALSTPQLTYDLLGLTPAQRHDFLKTLTVTERRQLLTGVRRDLGTPYGLWQDDPVGFCEQILSVALWSKQRELALSVEANERTNVPACHGPGKTYTAAMLVAWFVCVHEPGTAEAVTTAPRMRQVKMLLWPHIHRVHAAAGLPGELDQVQWKLPGLQLPVAYGFSAAEYDEDAVQGIHKEHLLIVVDEAGGIGHTLGRGLESITTGAHTRLLAIGNPPTDEEGSWFEERESSELWHTIRIGWEDTPNFTGEPVAAKTKAQLIDQKWVNDQVAEFGPDSTFVEARVHARFPHGSINKTIPWSWIEAAMENEQPEPSTWVRLGVDSAADGGDEFAIARAVGNRVDIVHSSSGPQNANPTDVAGKALEAIHEAERIRVELGEHAPVRVKVDAIGVGWAVAGLLRAWGQEGVHNAEIVDVVVSETANNAKKFHNKRAEMWWAGREAMRPRPEDPATGEAARPPQIRLGDEHFDKRCAAQLNAPKYGHDTQGRVQIEKKTDIKKRGLGSPDRAEAILLALYEPVVGEPAQTNAGLLLGRQ
jgi:hypothetical protein